MTYTEVLELIRAGYTKDEISALMKDEPKNNPDPSPNPTPEPSPEPEPKQDPQPEPQPEPESETSKLIRALGMQLDTLTKAVQKTNVETIEAKDNTNDPEQIIARIINPHYGEVK